MRAKQFRSRHQVAILSRGLLGVAQCRDAAGNDRYLGHRIGARHQLRHQSVARLMIGDGFLFLRTHDPAFFLQAGDDSFDRLVEIGHLDGFFALPRGQQRRLVDDVGQIGADKSRRLGGQQLRSTSAESLIFLAWSWRIFSPALDIRPVDQHLAVEPSRTQQRRIENLRPVGRRHDDHAFIRSRSRPSRRAAD